MIDFEARASRSRQLCVLLNSEDIYCTLAQILSDEPDVNFISLMVEHLNMILLTSFELFELRLKLKNLESKVRCSHLKFFVLLIVIYRLFGE